MTKEDLFLLKEKVLKLKKISDIDELLPKMNCYDFLLECNKDRLDKVAINYLGRTITYKQLFNMIDDAAEAFSKKGVKKGDYVSMSVLSTPEGIISFYALNKLGAVSHMINPTFSDKELIEYMNGVNSNMYVTMDLFYSNRIQKVIDQTQIKNVVVTSLMDSLPTGLNFDKVKYGIITEIKKFESPADLDDRCIEWKKFIKIKNNKTIKSVYEKNIDSCIAYTSGSTGVSKAVVSTNESMNSMPIQMGMTDQTFAPNDVIFNSLPLWIYYSLVNNIHDPLCLGVSVALDPIFNSKKISKRMKQYNFNHWNTIPAYVEDMCNDKNVKKLDLSNLKSITTGGDFLTSTLKNRADELLEKCNSQVKIGQGYGASEILGSFSYTYDKDSTIGSSGKPLVGNKAKIIDPDTNETLGYNQTGELYLFSPTIMKRYYNNDSATDEVLVKDEDGIIWYKTGDLAHISENGEIFIDGRIRRIVMTKDKGGFPTKIIPEKIKKEVLNNKYVKKCEVITVPDDEVFNKSIAFVVLNYDVDIAINYETIKHELEEHCLKRLPSYMVPRDIEIVKNIPLAPSLKPDLKKLEEMYNELNVDSKKKTKRIFK